MIWAEENPCRIDDLSSAQGSIRINETTQEKAGNRHLPRCIRRVLPFAFLCTQDAHQHLNPRTRLSAVAFLRQTLKDELAFLHKICAFLRRLVDLDMNPRVRLIKLHGGLEAEWDLLTRRCIKVFPANRKFSR